MTARRLWLALAAYGAVAAASLVLFDPGAPNARWPVPASVAVGTASGWALVAALGRVLPRPSARPALACVLIAAAAAEEVVWRRLVLGGLTNRAGALAALAASTLLFSLAHTRARATHVVTGAGFGALYLLSGGVLCACCAHGMYNLAVAGAASKRPHRGPGT